MISILVLFVSITAIECKNTLKICDVFAPNRVFSGGVKLYRFENQNGMKVIMYTIGENGGEWEIELKTNVGKKSIEFIGDAVKCCKDLVNRYSFKYFIKYNENMIRHCLIEKVITFH